MLAALHVDSSLRVVMTV